MATSNKSSNLYVRLSDLEKEQLESISKEIKLDKSKIVRFALNQFITEYYELTNKN